MKSAIAVIPIFIANSKGKGWHQVGVRVFREDGKELEQPEISARLNANG